MWFSVCFTLCLPKNFLTRPCAQFKSHLVPAARSLNYEVQSDPMTGKTKNRPFQYGEVTQYCHYFSMYQKLICWADKYPFDIYYYICIPHSLAMLCSSASGQHQWQLDFTYYPTCAKSQRRRVEIVSFACFLCTELPFISGQLSTCLFGTLSPIPAYCQYIDLISGHGSPSSDSYCFCADRLRELLRLPKLQRLAEDN